MNSGTIIRVPAERKQLAFIRDFVEQQAEGILVDPREKGDLIQAVDEAATNIIVHGYQDGPGEIEIEVRRKPAQLTVCLRDHAPIFDPTRVPPPDIHLPLEQRPVGGLGIYLIRQCVDGFSHRVGEAGGNEIVLVKRRKSKK